MGEGLSRGSYPIRLGLCLFPGAYATVGKVVVTAGDGLLDDPIRLVMVVDYWVRDVLQVWISLFNWHAEPFCSAVLFNRYR